MVSKGRLVMGLERFFVLIQLSIAPLSYEYPSVGKCPQGAQINKQSTEKFINIKEARADSNLYVVEKV